MERDLLQVNLYIIWIGCFFVVYNMIKRLLYFSSSVFCQTKALTISSTWEIRQPHSVTRLTSNYNKLQYKRVTIDFCGFWTFKHWQNVYERKFCCIKDCNFIKEKSWNVLNDFLLRLSLRIIWEEAVFAFQVSVGWEK